MRNSFSTIRFLAATAALTAALSCGGDAITDPKTTGQNDNPTTGNPTTPTTPTTPTSPNTDQLVADYLSEMSGGQSAVGQSSTAAAGAGAGRMVPISRGLSGGKALLAESPIICVRDTVNTRFNCPP